VAPIWHGQEQVTVRRDDPDLLQPRDGVCHVLDDMIGDHHVEPSVDVLGEPYVLDDVLRIHDAAGGVPRVLGELSHQLVAREPGVEGPDLENASAPDIRPVIGELTSGWSAHEPSTVLANAAVEVESNIRSCRTNSQRLLSISVGVGSAPYAIADGRREPGPGDPTVVICEQHAPRRRRRRATYNRPHGVRQLLAG